MRTEIVREHLNNMLKNLSPATIVDRLLIPMVTEDQVKGMLMGSIPLTKPLTFLLTSTVLEVDASKKQVVLPVEAKPHMDAIIAEFGHFNANEMMAELMKEWKKPGGLH